MMECRHALTWKLSWPLLWLWNPPKNIGNAYCPMYTFLLEKQMNLDYENSESFLGPPTGMAGEASSDSKSAWDPFVLGMRKHKLLIEDILPSMASNRKVHRLLNEFMDLVSEYEIAPVTEDIAANDQQKSEWFTRNRYRGHCSIKIRSKVS